MSALHLLEPVARVVAAVTLNALWEDLLICIAVALLLRAWRTLNAATRYGVWFVALVAAVVVPLVTTPLSGAPGTAPATAHHLRLAAYHTVQTTAQADVATAAGAAALSQPSRSTARPAAVARPRLTMPDDMSLAILALWIAVSLYFLVTLLLGLVKLERLKRNALPLPLEYRDAFARFDARAAAGRDVRLCVSDETEVPVAVGLFDAMILIPRHLLESLAPEELEQVCLHEIAHLRRGDDWTNLVQRAASAVAWFSPAVYAIARGLDLEREVACDDDVVAKMGAVRPYARCLTRMAEVTAWPHRALAAPGAFVTRRGISERVERLLHAGRNVARGIAFAPTAVALAVVGALALGMPVLAVTVAAPAVPAPSPVPRVAPVHRTARVHHVYVPATHVYVPATHVYVPASHVHVPGTHVHVPPVDARVPAVNVDVPGMNFTIPAIDVNVPAVNVNIPDYSDYGRRIEREFRSPSCRSGCDFNDVRWPGANFVGRSLSASDFNDADLQGANFSHARLQAVDFTDADLRHADFDGAKLSYVDFTDARLAGATFAGATIAVCDFSDADVTGVDFSRARLDAICRQSLSDR